MKPILQDIKTILSDFEVKLSAINENSFSAKPNPAKWSKKEVLGHLIDSGNNNLRRFICGQYETSPPHIIYDQDFWVTANGYNTVSQQDLVRLWVLINTQICTVLSKMPVSNYKLQCNTGKLNPQLHSLEWLAEDYVKHLKHHLNQIIPNSFDVVYP